MTQTSPPYCLQAGSHSAETFRRAISTLLGSAGGIVAAGDYAVSQHGGGNMSVDVAGGVPGGQAWVPGSSVPSQGLYQTYNNATATLAVAASDVTNARVDVVEIQISDSAYAGVTDSAALTVLTGTPSGSPVAPSLSASSLALANLAVAANATQILTANITDRRSQVRFGTISPAYGAPWSGSSIIAATESRTNTAYGTLTTPDQVAGLVLPTNGIIEVLYQATWQESVTGAARAAIFIGANQMQIATDAIAGSNAATVQEQAKTAAGTANFDMPLASSPIGLVGVTTSGKSTGHSDVTTGQAIGLLGFGGNVRAEIVDPGNSSNVTAISVAMGFGGPVQLFLNAGTYTISVQFKSSSGSVTAKNRRLYCRVKPY